ncbi:hypothetical protein AMAG_02788 [Allomyces macrogynus ATCC 38327]|uniref:Uncharacterized protein n=1 Tax=Allomyces macrogynus (strain ATCC 38327) TaxID=578462 RepID=A0A0L0S3T2_ALLM3|nr:hypothetical protein AMAG_02788 [Allomyces macrogynus ATCC 38327]|eukprot:KNE57029.1 hypothetical protein AMAG_02788 [Allomyces macrogynus ATCC 38327]
MPAAAIATTPHDPTAVASPTAQFLVHVEAPCFEPYSVPLVADLRAIEAVRIAEAMPLASESRATAATGAADDSGVDMDAILEVDDWAVDIDTDLPAAPDRVAAVAARIHVHVYAAAEKPDEFETASSVADGTGMDVDGSEVNPLFGTPIPPPPSPASTVADLARLLGARVTPLRARELDALWHQLVFAEPNAQALPLPYRLLHAAQMSLHMAMGGVDEHLAPPTRTMLFHGHRLRTPSTPAHAHLTPLHQTLLSPECMVQFLENPSASRTLHDLAQRVPSGSAALLA